MMSGLSGNGFRTALTLLVACVALLTACGGGGGSSIGGSVASGGIGGTGISKGPVTAYGSIVVNGVHFDISSAQFYRDGQPVKAAPGIGEVVVVTGDFDANGRTGTAERVAYRPLVVGPVTRAPDPASHTLGILGQTVEVDTRTVFDGFTGLSDLQPGDRVEVSGLFTAGGSIRATLLRLDTGTGLRLQGRVHDLNTGTRTFHIGNQTVSYTTLRQQEPAELHNGDFIEVRATGTLDGDGTLDASRILARSRSLPTEAGDEVEIAGFVNQLVGANQFRVSGITVSITPDTEFEGGSAADLAPDARVEVEGTTDAQGQLVAEEIEFQPEGVVEITAPVQQTQCTDSDCRTGTLTLLDISVHINVDTVLESNDDGTALSLAKVQHGDWLQINAYRNAAGTLTAGHVEREDVETAVTLAGKVQSKNAANQQFTLLDVVIHTSGADFDDGNAAAFYAALQPGDVVEVTGTRTSTRNISASTVERED